MKIELNGKLTKNIEEITNLQELNDLKATINKELDKTNRKIKIQLLELSLDIINGRIVDISHNMAYSNKIHTIV